MRLGISKSGIAEWNVNNPYIAAGISSRRRAPVGVAAVRPQLNGRFGNNDAPRRLRANQQFKPQGYAAPDRRARARPAALTTLSEIEKNALSTVSKQG